MAKHMNCFPLWLLLAIIYMAMVAEARFKAAKECNGKCYSSGDPHYQTFDCKKFEFHGKCSYTLMVSCNEKIPFFQVIGDNEPLPYHPRLAYTKNVIIRTTHEEIRLTADKGIFINNEKQRGDIVEIINGTIVKTEHEIVVKLDFGFKVTWGSPFKAEITLTDDTLKENVCGICGNANDDPKDDFVTSKNQQVTDADAVAFAESWKTEETCGPSLDNIRIDQRCGPGYLAPNGKEAECNPNGEYPCCSKYGWCGITQAHCVSKLYKDYRVSTQQATTIAPTQVQKLSGNFGQTGAVNNAVF